MTLRLRTFGAVHLEREGAPLGGAHGQRRRLVLLAYLAATGGAPVSREKLVALLWPESDEGSGRHSLSQLLYALRHDLDAGALEVTAETVRLDPRLLASDSNAFDEAIRDRRLEDAVSEYRGAFLDGLHVDDAPDLERWIENERARRAAACAQALDRLADAAGEARDHHREVDWMRRRVVLEPTNGRATLRLMQALTRIGDRDGALRAARVYETLIRDELEAEPDHAVADLAASLRGAVRAAPTPSVDAGSAASPPHVAEAARKPASGEAPHEHMTPSDQRRSGVGTRRWMAVAVVALVSATALTFGSWRASPSAPSPIQAAAVVVVGDLGGPDPALALAVREALRAELVNATGVQLMSDAGRLELETLMRLPRQSPLRPPELLALAARAGAHVAVTGSVVPVGPGAQIVLELLDPASGRPMRTFTERPSDGRATLAAVERLARSIGDAVSRAPRDPGVRPLPAVTTASLEALKSYAIARQTAALGNRKEAIAPAEWAITRDSTFVLAHYFLGDLLWFLDEQSHADAHLTKAYELASTVPAREQLVIRARYEQLVRDRPDSALVYWQLLRESSPADVLAYEGRAWALRALGRHEEAAASADTAMSLDPGAIAPNTNNALYSWLAVGDTANALVVARRVAPRNHDALIEAHFFAALFHDPRAALVWADSTTVDRTRHWRRHLAQVAAGDLRDARATLDSVIADDAAQCAPNALIHQGWLELVIGRRDGGEAMRRGERAAARYARAALDWTRRRDLSPPAVGRLAERIADLAARTGDAATVQQAAALVRQRDRGRSLRTYVMAARALEAAGAYARRDYAGAAHLAEGARHGVYFSRSLATLVLLEADARRSAGEVSAADSLTRLVTSHQIVDGHFEAWAMLRAMIQLDTSRGGASAAR